MQHWCSPAYLFFVDASGKRLSMEGSSREEKAVGEQAPLDNIFNQAFSEQIAKAIKEGREYILVESQPEGQSNAQADGRLLEVTIAPQKKGFLLSVIPFRNISAYYNCSRVMLDIVKSHLPLQQKSLLSGICQLTGYSKAAFLRFGTNQTAEVKETHQPPKANTATFLCKTVLKGLSFYRADFDQGLTQALSAYSLLAMPNLTDDQLFRPHADSLQQMGNQRYSSLLQNTGYHRKYFRNMGAEACLFFPITKAGQLQGFIMVLNEHPKFVNSQQLESCLALLEIFKSQTESNPHTVSDNATTKNPSTQDFIDGLEQSFLPEAFAKNQQSLLEVALADGLLLLHNGQLYSHGNVPVKEKCWQLAKYVNEQMIAGFFQTQTLAKKQKSFIGIRHQASGVMAITLDEGSMIIWLRGESDLVYKLVGNPLPEGKVRETFHPFISLSSSTSEAWENTIISSVKELQRQLNKILIQKAQQYQSQMETLTSHLTSIPIGAAVLDKAYHLSYANQAFQVITKSETNYLANHWQEMVVESYRPMLSTMLDAHWQQENPFPEGIIVEIQIQKTERLWVRLYLAPQAQKMTSGPQLLLYLQDISKEMQFAKSLKAFELAMANAEMGLMVLKETDKGIVPHFCSQPFSKLTSIKASNEHIFNFDQLIQPDRPNDLARLQEALSQNEEVYCRSQIIGRFADTSCFVDIHLIPQTKNEASPKEKSFIVLIYDRRRQTEKDVQLDGFSTLLKNVKEELRTFAYVASHDLQEPLRTIVGFSELLSQNYEQGVNKDSREYLQYIMQASKRMKGLIKDLLAFSRIGSSQEFSKEVNLNNVLFDVLENLRSSIMETNADINYSSLPVIYGNENMLLQVFQNFVGNAIKYHKKGEPPKITIDYKELPREWIFEIKDNGIGIDPKYYDRIFQVFQRLHNEEEYSGTGIGLAICKKIIEKYGGKVWVRSDDAAGSTFFFSLPKSSTNITQ